MEYPIPVMKKLSYQVRLLKKRDKKGVDFKKYGFHFLPTQWTKYHQPVHQSLARFFKY